MGSFFSFFMLWLNLAAISLGLINIWYRLAVMSSASQQPRLIMGFFFFFFSTSTHLAHLHLPVSPVPRAGPLLLAGSPGASVEEQPPSPPLVVYLRPQGPRSHLRPGYLPPSCGFCHSPLPWPGALRLAWRWWVVLDRVVSVLLQLR